jgi:hypothetical protein
MLLSVWLEFLPFLSFYLFIENCEIENVVTYFQQVKGVPLRSETLIVGAWYSIEPDWVLTLCQRLPSPWSKLNNDYIIFYRIHFQSLADLSTPVKSNRIPGTHN